MYIGPFQYEIKWQEGSIYEDFNYGACIEADHTILLSTSPDEKKKMSTLIHEALEAYNSTYEIRLRHHQINLLEISMYDFITRNPDIIKRILNEDLDRDKNKI